VLVLSPAAAGQADLAAALSFQDQRPACSQAGMLQSIAMAAAATGPACVRSAVSHQQLLHNLLWRPSHVSLCYMLRSVRAVDSGPICINFATCDVHAQIAL